MKSSNKGNVYECQKIWLISLTSLYLNYNSCLHQTHYSLANSHYEILRCDKAIVTAPGQIQLLQILATFGQ